jgi:secreted trypsin-like serine protease
MKRSCSSWLHGNDPARSFFRPWIAGTGLCLLGLLNGPCAASGQELPADVANESAKSYPASIVKDAKGKQPAELPTQSKVVGGKSAHAGQFKWQVGIIRSEAPVEEPFDGFFCGGSLIGWRWVLTAAHCTYENNPQGKGLPPIELDPAAINIYLGSYNFSGGQRVAVKRIIRHEGYSRKSDDNDLALIELDEEPSDKSTLELLRLIRAGNEAPIQSGKRATVLGWGSTVQGVVPALMREAVQTLQYADDLQFKDSDLCNEYYIRDRRAAITTFLKKKGESDERIRQSLDEWYPPGKRLITENMVCAGTNNGSKDSCFGDSGGPLTVYSGGPVQAGIVSWGPGNGCGLTNLFGVYVRVSQYLDWISSKMK